MEQKENKREREGVRECGGGVDGGRAETATQRVTDSDRSREQERERERGRK